MKKLLGVGASIAVLLVIAATAGAAALWTNTARNVESIITDRWNTSDGEPIVSASCHGLWSYPHVRTRRGLEFHRFRCIERDDVDRRFTVSVVVVGAGFKPVSVVVVGAGFKLRATELACNDAASDESCP